MTVDVKDLRRRMGGGEKPISQQELAQRLGVNQATVSRLEAGAPQTGSTAILLDRLDAEFVERQSGSGPGHGPNGDHADLHTQDAA